MDNLAERLPKCYTFIQMISIYQTPVIKAILDSDMAILPMYIREHYYDNCEEPWYEMKLRLLHDVVIESYNHAFGYYGPRFAGDEEYPKELKKKAGFNKLFKEWIDSIV